MSLAWHSSLPAADQRVASDPRCTEPLPLVSGVEFFGAVLAIMMSQSGSIPYLRQRVGKPGPSIKAANDRRCRERPKESPISNLRAAIMAGGWRRGWAGIGDGSRVRSRTRDRSLHLGT